MTSAAIASRATRASRRQPDSSNAAHRRLCAFRLAVRLIRATEPKSAKMFAASDMTSRCEAQSSRLVPSRTARHLQRASRSWQISRTGSKSPTEWCVPQRWSSTFAFRNGVVCAEHETQQPKTAQETKQVFRNNISPGRFLGNNRRGCLQTSHTKDEGAPGWVRWSDRAT